MSEDCVMNVGYPYRLCHHGSMVDANVKVSSTKRQYGSQMTIVLGARESLVRGEGSAAKSTPEGKRRWDLQSPK